MNIYNLKHGQAVKVGDKLLVGLKNDTHRIDWRLFEATSGDWGGVSEYQFHKDEIIETQLGGHSIITFESDNEVLSASEYHAQKDAIISDYMTDDDEYVVYPDLETEFRVRKELDSFVSKYERVNSKSDFYYETLVLDIIAEAIDTESKFIQTPLVMGQTSWGRKDGFFKVFLSSIAKNEWLKQVGKYGDDYKMYTPDHSNIEFVKINNEYVFTSSKHDFHGVDKKAVRVVNTLDEAQLLEKQTRDNVKKGVLLIINENRLISVDNAQVILSTINGIRSEVLAIDSKVKTAKKRSSAISELNKLVTSLEDFIAYGE